MTLCGRWFAAVIGIICVFLGRRFELPHFLGVMGSICFVLMLCWQLQTGNYDEFKLTRGWVISSFLAVCYFTLLVWHPVNYTALLFLDGTLEGTYATPLLIPTETGQWIIAAEKHKWQDHPINASCFGKRISVADVPELNDDGHSRAVTMEEQLRSKVAHRYVEEWLRPHRDTPGVTDLPSYNPYPLVDFSFVKQEAGAAKNLGPDGEGCRAGDGIRFYLPLSAGGGVVAFPGYRDVFVPEGTVLLFPAQLRHAFSEPQHDRDEAGGVGLVGLTGTFVPHHGGLRGLTVAWPLWGQGASCAMLQEHAGRETPTVFTECDRLAPLRELFAAKQLATLLSPTAMVLMGVMMALWVGKKWVSHSVRKSATMAASVAQQERDKATVPPRDQAGSGEAKKDR